MRYFRIVSFTGIEAHRDDADRGSLRLVEGCIPHGQGGLRSGPVWEKLGDIPEYSESSENHLHGADDVNGNSLIFVSRDEEVHDLHVFSNEGSNLDGWVETYPIADSTSYVIDKSFLSPIGNRLYSFGDGSSEAVFVGLGNPVSAKEVFPDLKEYHQEWSRFPKCTMFLVGPNKCIFASGNPEAPLTVYITEPASITVPERDSPYSTPDSSQFGGNLSTVDILMSNATKITALSVRQETVVVHTDKGAHLLYPPQNDQDPSGFRTKQAPSGVFSAAVNPQVVQGEKDQKYWLGHDGQIYKDESTTRSAELAVEPSDKDQATAKSKGEWDKHLPDDLSNSFSTHSSQGGMYWVFVESDEYKAFTSGYIPGRTLGLTAEVLEDSVDVSELTIESIESDLPDSVKLIADPAGTDAPGETGELDAYEIIPDPIPIVPGISEIRVTQIDVDRPGRVWVFGIDSLVSDAPGSPALVVTSTEVMQITDLEVDEIISDAPNAPVDLEFIPDNAPGQVDLEIDSIQSEKPGKPGWLFIPIATPWSPGGIISDPPDAPILEVPVPDATFLYPTTIISDPPYPPYLNASVWRDLDCAGLLNTYGYNRGNDIYMTVIGNMFGAQQQGNIVDTPFFRTSPWANLDSNSNIDLFPDTEAKAKAAGYSYVYPEGGVTRLVDSYMHRPQGGSMFLKKAYNAWAKFTYSGLKDVDSFRHGYISMPGNGRPSWKLVSGKVNGNWTETFHWHLCASDSTGQYYLYMTTRADLILKRWEMGDGRGECDPFGVGINGPQWTSFDLRPYVGPSPQSQGVCHPAGFTKFLASEKNDYDAGGSACGSVDPFEIVFPPSGGTEPGYTPPPPPTIPGVGTPTTVEDLQDIIDSMVDRGLTDQRSNMSNAGMRASYDGMYPIDSKALVDMAEVYDWTDNQLAEMEEILQFLWKINYQPMLGIESFLGEIAPGSVARAWGWASGSLTWFRKIGSTKLPSGILVMNSKCLESDTNDYVKAFGFPRGQQFIETFRHEAIHAGQDAEAGASNQYLARLGAPASEGGYDTFDFARAVMAGQEWHGLYSGSLKTNAGISDVEDHYFPSHPDGIPLYIALMELEGNSAENSEAMARLGRNLALDAIWNNPIPEQIIVTTSGINMGKTALNLTAQLAGYSTDHEPDPGIEGHVRTDSIEYKYLDYVKKQPAGSLADGAYTFCTRCTMAHELNKCKLLQND